MRACLALDGWNWRVRCGVVFAVIRLTISGLLLAAGCMAATGPHYYSDDDGTVDNSGDGGGSSCTAVALTTTPVTPAIMLLIDGSGSMGDGFGNTNKYNAVANALLDSTTGVVFMLKKKNKNNTTKNTNKQNPRLYSTSCTLNNAAGIARSCT